MISAIIPAKSVSVRVPDKNIIDLGGKPLFEWTFDICKNFPFDRVIVATDADYIKQKCEEYNFCIQELSKDDLEDKRTVRELWKSLAERYGGCHVLLQLISPFRSLNTLHRAIKKYQEGEYDIVVSVKTEHDAQVNELGKSMKSNMKRLSQKERPHYYIAGTFWIADAEYIKNSQVDLQEGNICIFPVNQMSSIDINTQDDLKFARVVAKGLQKAHDL